MFLKRPFQKSHDINEKLFYVDTNDEYKKYFYKFSDCYVLLVEYRSISMNDMLILLHIYKLICYTITYLR